MRKGTTFQDLHNIWSFRTSLKTVIFAGRGFNLVALAALIMAALPVHGLIAQKAFFVTDRNQPMPVTIPVEAAQPIIMGVATGRITSDNNHTVSALADTMLATLTRHLDGPPPSVGDTPCGGLCFAILREAGYEVKCDESTESFDNPTTSPA